MSRSLFSLLSSLFSLLSFFHPFLTNHWIVLIFKSLSFSSLSSLYQILYVIEVVCGVQKWAVQRSYMDFSVLHRILSQSYPGIGFPLLPPRTLETKKKYVEMRGKLQKYLRKLLDCTFQENLSKVFFFFSFF